MARPREIDNLPEHVRLVAEADLDNGANPKAVWERHTLEAWITLRTFQAWATRRARGHRVERITEQANMFRAILDSLGIEREGLSKIEQIQLGAAMRGMLNGGKPTAVLRAVEVANDIRRTQLRDEAQQIAQEKHAAWRAEHNKKLLAEAAKKAKSSGGKVTVADIAKMLEEIDMGEAA